MGTYPSFADLLDLASHDAWANASRHLNPKLLQLVALTGLDRRWVRGEGCWLVDDRGDRFLDCVGGFAVHALGRNHPAVVRALTEALASGHPNWVRFEANGLAALLAGRLAARMPGDLPHAFFANSGTEAVEAALKFARRATGRSGVIGCGRGFHGLTLGALAANGTDELREGFGDLGEHAIVPFNDLPALEAALASRRHAAFVV